jgi:hypothetical protein
MCPELLPIESSRFSPAIPGRAEKRKKIYYTYKRRLLILTHRILKTKKTEKIVKCEVSYYGTLNIIALKRFYKV